MVFQVEKDANFLWRLARATHYVARIQATQRNKEKEKKFDYASKQIMANAMKIDDKNPQVHKWYVAYQIADVNRINPRAINTAYQSRI